MTIRTPSAADADRIRQIHLDAFEADERELVAELACGLLETHSDPQTLKLVVELEGELVGYVAFSPVWAAEDQSFVGYTLAPLAVSPDQQKKGIGSSLVKEGLRQLLAQGVEVVLVYGDPKYYGRFGFELKLGESYPAPFPLVYPFGWQAVHLSGKAAPERSISITCVDALNKPELW